MVVESKYLEGKSSKANKDISDYELQCILGEGSYGKVYLANEKAS